MTTTEVPGPPTATTHACIICGAQAGDGTFCPDCQNTLDAEDAARRAARARALDGDAIAEAIRAHLATLNQQGLIVAEHRAQFRVANAERGVMYTKRLVDIGTLLQSSLDAAHDEVEAARHVLGLVHEQQQIQVARALTCEVCGGPSDAAECTSCVIAADIAFTRGQDR